MVKHKSCLELTFWCIHMRAVRSFLEILFHFVLPLIFIPFHSIAFHFVCFQVIDPEDMSQRARWTIIATACLLLLMCLLLVGVTLRMAPLIDDMGKSIQIHISLQYVENWFSRFTVVTVYQFLYNGKIFVWRWIVEISTK